MKVVKVINNNVVSSVDDKGEEIVLMGKGIGFQKKTGDVICEEKVEKAFRSFGSQTNEFMKLVEEVPYENIKLAEEIIHYAKSQLKAKLSNNIYITLTDHLNFALERQKQGMVFHNELLWEIQKFYQAEYQIGLKALDIIDEKLGVRLSEDEAGFFALHLVNAEMNGSMSQTLSMPGIIKDVTDIVKYTIQVDIEEGTLYYDRFVTHLKFLLQRAIRGEEYDEGDPSFNQSVSEHYPDARRCALKVKNYLDQKLPHEVSDEELTYLTIHIARMMRRG